MTARRPRQQADGQGTPKRRRRGPRRTLAAGIAVLLTVSLAGCLPNFLVPDIPNRTSTPTEENVPAALAPFYGQVLQWTNCGHGLQCSAAKAPLDWSEPSSGEIKLALIRQPATGTSHGSLLVNPGGPGGSGFDFIRESIDYATDATLQKNFDIVGFDPRGVGRSTAVACYDARQMDAYLYDVSTLKRGSDAWIAEQRKVATEFGAACALNTGPLLGHVDTVSAARDLDLLRAVLGDAKLHYLGYSYGTYLGAVYAGLHPDKVGRVVLDGALDPSASNFEVTKVQAEGFESALRAYLDSCVRGSDCPFTGTADQAMSKVGALLASVEANPIRNPDGRMLGANTLLTAIIYPLYDPNAWSLLTGMLVDVMSGSAEAAFQLADAYNSRSANGTYTDNSTEAFMAINCLDYRYDDDPATMRAQAAQLAEVAPVIGPYMGFGDIGCASWPAESTVDRGPIAAKGAPAIVVIGTTNDPATPYVWAQALAGQLDSGHLVTYQGEGHTAYNKSNACVNDAVDAYLVQGEVPADGLRC